MEYQIDMFVAAPDMTTIERALLALDAAAVIDLSGSVLRVSTSASAQEIAGAITGAGYAIGQGQVRLQPSVCCGGCGG